MSSSSSSYFNTRRSSASDRRSGFNDRSSGFGNRRSGRAQFSRRIKTFDPSMVVKQSIIAVPKKEYVATHKFNEFAIADQLKQNITACGYVTPTPIQDQAIEHILNQEDLIGLANTGTGKTAAFLIPLINNVMANRTKKVLIMAPTRELVEQTESEFRIFAKGTGIYSTLCIGGMSIKNQINNLKRNPHFVIGTPGRLIDLVERRKLDLSSFSILVLDEVDRMLDMGFIHDMEFVMGRMPKTRQTLFFSATLPIKLNQVIYRFSKNPIKIQVEAQSAATNVNQNIIKINGQSKVDILQNLLKQEGFDKVLVFGRTKFGLNTLSKKLLERGFKTAIIHGNKSQGQRQQALNQFKNDRVKVLLATDVASRGLDIDDVTHVINYDLPESYEAYIHRIGRTGRANKTGSALSFVD